MAFDETLAERIRQGLARRKNIEGRRVRRQAAREVELPEIVERHDP
jgi:hypothetical protein